MLEQQQMHGMRPAQSVHTHLPCGVAFPAETLNDPPFHTGLFPGGSGSGGPFPALLTVALPPLERKGLLLTHQDLH